MSCETALEFLLQGDWDVDRCRRTMEVINHLDACEACHAAARDFDELRLALSPDRPLEPTGGWNAMQRRLASQIPPRRQAWLRPALAIAALVLAAFGIFQAGRETATQSHATISINNPLPAEPNALPISARELSHDVLAFREVSDVYEGHAGWMMVSQNASDVGMISEPASASKKVLMLRLELWQGKERVSNADLVVLAGQRADLTLPLPSGRSLHYRIGTSTDEPTQLTVSLELKTPAGGEPLAALATNLQVQPGQKLSAGKLATTAGEYELKIDFAGAEVANGKQ